VLRRGPRGCSVGPFFTGLTINQDPALFTEEELITARLIRDQYTGGNFSVATNMPALLKLFTHCGFEMPGLKTVRLMSQHSTSLHTFQLGFKDSFSLTNYFKPGIDFGPIHGDDLYYQVYSVFG